MTQLDSHVRLRSAGLAASFALSISLLGCGDDSGSKADPDNTVVQGDADTDRTADGGDGGPIPGDDDADLRDPDADCKAEAERETEFVAAHRACAVDADCVAVGSCDNADFIAVSTSAQAEAEALVEARTCKAQDGSAFYAVCRASQCTLAVAPHVCGEEPRQACPEGQSRQSLACDESGPRLGSACYAACTLADDSACAPGLTCQETSVHACADDSSGVVQCEACTETQTLCRPDSSCELVLRVELEGEPTITSTPDGAMPLVVSVENTTDAPLTFSYEAPCAGLPLTGLFDFDVWNACLAGACEKPSETKTVTLAAHEVRVLAETLLSFGSSTCNPEGLAQGKYELSVTLPGLSGAKACGPSPAELRVVPGSLNGNI